MPGYGCGIGSFLFDLASIPDYESRIADEINKQIEKYMPFLLVKNVDILDYAKTLDGNNLEDRNGMAAILLRITYDVQKISVLNQKLEVVIFSGG